MGSFTLTESGINGALAFALEAASAPSWVSAIAGPILSSQQETEKYRFSGMAPALRQWVGERQAKRLAEFAQNTSNVKYETTLEVFSEELKWDRTGQVQQRINDLAGRAAQHWASLMTTKMESTDDAYDDVDFFSDSHLNGDAATVDNNISYNVTTTTAPTAAEMEQVILDIIETFMAFTDETGEPANETLQAITLIVPPKFVSATAAAINNPVLSDGNGARTNIVQSAMGDFRVSYAVNPRFTAANDILYAFRTDNIGMPAMYRQADIPSESSSDTADVTIQSQGENSDYFFETDKLRFGLKAYRAVDVGDFRKAIKITLT
tara:strand:+ start:1780 stop:2745 length:966 start_codon:yes stop_codon:yes gene_type:complete